MGAACKEILKWAQKKATSKFEDAAWDLKTFEQLSSGRSRICVRIQNELADVWAIRVEDPDTSVPGRIWTTELVVSDFHSDDVRFTARQIVSSSESTLDGIEPHVPGVVRQIIQRPGLYSGAYRLTDRPMRIMSEGDVNLLISALLDPGRTLPIVILTVPSTSVDQYKPLLDARNLAQACAGLAIIIVLPACFTWALTEKFGQRLSVFEGAVRIYLQGFTEDANPFGGHDLILPDRFSTPEGATTTLRRLRWSSALGSVRRLTLGSDVIPFATLRLQNLEERQLRLRDAGASEEEQLAAAESRILTIEEQLREAERFQKDFSDLHQQAEARAAAAEAQALAAGFRIRQLIDQINEVGKKPDENISLPLTWAEFADWCDVNLAGRVMLAPQARRSLKSSTFIDVAVAARCLLWLANDLYNAKSSDMGGSLRDRVIEPGIINSHCGSDQFLIDWQNGRHSVDWHIKNGGNTRDPSRCLRIYYFWDDRSQQAVVAHMPEHRRTEAS